MVGDGAERVSEVDAGFDDVLERLAAIAPRRVHLEIAAIVLDPRPGQRRVAQRAEDLRAAEGMIAKAAAALDILLLAAAGDRALDGRRSAGLKDLENDPRGRGT